tara:strand:- start:533 stop:856 length:324 start_codon:yes stop_codon:yes gene_type:complete
MDEGMYLDAMNQLKEKFETNEKEMNKLKKKNYVLKHFILSLYGLIDSSWGILQSLDVPYESMLIMDVLKEKVSDYIDSEVLGFNDKELDEIQILGTINIDVENLNSQ